ncbi:MAG TPA: D-glycerate dehydrogenase [Methylomirabilota bacterium]|nr:D-glycerate dehydrogenase [Methylomirabilota bacterium]
MPRVLITRELPREALAVAHQRFDVDLPPTDRPLSRGEFMSRLRDKAGLVCLLTDTIDEEILNAAPSLKVVSNVAVGYNNIDVAACTRRGVVVTNTPGVLTETTADFTWALLLAVARRVVEGDRYVRSGQFKEWQLLFLLGTDVHGKTLGILGFGRIGQAVARRARGFGMRLLYYDPQRVDRVVEDELGARYVDKAALLRESDFLTIHALLTPETHHLIGANELRAMKPTAFLINAARGPIVHEEALVQALREGWIAGAGLDVYEEEPTVHPGLLEAKNAVLAPHIASASRETRTKMALMAVENCLAVLEGRIPPNPVNPEVLKT